MLQPSIQQYRSSKDEIGHERRAQQKVAPLQQQSKAPEPKPYIGTVNPEPEPKLQVREMPQAQAVQQKKKVILKEPEKAFTTD